MAVRLCDRCASAPKEDEKLTTVVDVARRAGVSIATVSRVLRGTPNVTETTRRKVMEAVAELGYLPNRMAQGLRLGRTNTVAFAVGDIEQTIYAALAKHLQNALEMIGFDLMLFNLGHSESRLINLFEAARHLGLRAIVLASSDALPECDLEDHGRRLAEHGITLISLHQDLSALGIPSVVYNEAETVQASVRRLIAADRCPVAYVGRISGSIIGSIRYGGYRAALEEAGLPLDERLVWDVFYRYQAGHDAISQACRAGFEFGAVQAGSDELAMGAIGALAECGREVPRDVAVCGFGNVQWGAYTRPTLSTASSDPEAIAANVVDMFRVLSEGGAPPLLTTLDRKLICRGSG